MTRRPLQIHRQLVLRRLELAALLIVGISLTPGGNPLRAQSLPGGKLAHPSSLTVALSMKQAVQLALKENPRLLIARLLVDEKNQDRAAALAALLPQASLAAREAIIRFNEQSIIDGPRPVRVGPFQALSGGAVFSQPLVNLGLIRNYQASRQSVETASHEEKTAREEITQAIVSRYLSVLHAIADYQAATTRVALAQRLYAQAQNLQKTGVGTDIDTLRAEVELQNEKQHMIDAKTQRDTSLYALAQPLDLPQDQEPTVTDSMRFYDLPNYNREQLIAEALENRPEMRALISQQRTAHLQTKAASEQRLPSLGFSGFYDYQARRPDDGMPGYTYAFTLQMPLWTSGRLRADRTRAKLEEQHVAEERENLTTAIVQQVKTALVQVEDARHSVEVANLGLKLAQDEVARAERRFQAGVTTNIEVITAQDELARADDNQIGALYRFNQARADLELALGNAENVYGQ